MKLHDLCAGVKPSCYIRKSRESFIDGLFEAAGADANISISYKRQLCNGDIPFSVELRTIFRGRDNLQSLIAFFSTEIADDKVGDVLLAFGIPEKNEPVKEALYFALANQMRTIIDSDEEDAPDILILEYQQAKLSNGASPTAALPNPLYRGDSVSTNHQLNYRINCYDVFEHTWTLENTGKAAWIGRRLVYMRKPKDRPEARPSSIDIPTVKPGESIKISTTFDGRGFEGVTHCIWEMQDSDGENCFPGRDLLFSVTIDAVFKRKVYGGK